MELQGRQITTAKRYKDNNVTFWTPGVPFTKHVKNRIQFASTPRRDNKDPSVSRHRIICVLQKMFQTTEMKELCRAMLLAWICRSSPYLTRCLAMRTRPWEPTLTSCNTKDGWPRSA
eukprot:1160741-Pelagomonas_calceolata.AAC.13